VSHKKIGKIKNVTWAQPIMLSKKSQEIFINLHPDQYDANYEVCTKGTDNKNVVHARGKLIYKRPKTTIPEVEMIDLNQIKKRCTNIIKGEDCYAFFASHHMIYGPKFRPVKKIYGSDLEALSELEMPSQLIDEEQTEEFLLHPAMLDGALQTLSGLTDNSISSSGMLTGTPYLPFALGEIEMLKPIPPKCFAHVKDKSSRTDQNGPDNPIKKFEINIIDEYGRIIVRLKNFSARAFDNSKNLHQTIYCRQIRVKSVLHGNGKHYDKNEFFDLGTLMIFDVNEKLANIFYKRFGKEQSVSGDIILVKPGKRLQHKGLIKGTGVHLYEVKPGSHNDFKNLIQELKQKSLIPDKIIHNWSHNDISLNRNEPVHHLELGFYSLFFLTKELMETQNKESVKLIMLAFQEKNVIKPFYRGMSSFNRSVGMENRKFMYKNVTWITSTKTDKTDDQEDLSQIVESLVCEFKMPLSEGQEITYENKTRYTRQISEIPQDQISAPAPILDLTTTLKNQGVYLITGGVGGLGLIFANFLGEKVKAKLVLTGRSKLSDKKYLKLREIEKLGAEVLYVQTDISKLDEVKKLIAKARTRFEKIDGVIHGAGVIQDAYIKNKTKAEIDAVLASKIWGTIYLDEALKDENLDFFTVFSSLSAVIGNSGQSDYAYANGFMDAFVIQRDLMFQDKKRQGKSLSINWPLWQEGGMKVDEKTQEIIENYTGIKPLLTQTGCDAFIHGLSSNEKGLIVLQGDRPKMMRMLELTKEKRQSKPDNKKHVVSHDKTLLKNIQKQVVGIVSKILKIEENRIDLEEDISTYGFGSITFTEFAFQMNKKFNLDLTPVIFFEHTSIGSFALYLFEMYPEHFDKSTSQEVKNFDSENSSLNFNHTNRFNKTHRPGSEDEKGIVNVESLQEPIAIIGMSGRYPMANNIEDFWLNLINAKDCISKIPPERWNLLTAYKPYGHIAEEPACKWGGFINDVDKFDPLFFNISPAEAEWMDPQLRLLLEVVWETIEDAAYTKDALKAKNLKTGIFIGAMSQQYPLVAKDKNAAKLLLNSSFWSIVNRISYVFNFQGPSIAIDTACSSSLTAVHMACESIRRRECKTAVAGGINLCLSPSKYLALNQFGMLSSNRKSKSLGDGDGMVPGEGVGAILLKPFSMAQQDRDHIYGIIKGSSVNHGGRTSNYMAPNLNAQADLMIQALENANIDARTISYVESAAIGSTLGDPIEVAALQKAYRKFTKDRHFCALGSVKSNIGHIEAASGMAQITKTLLQMKHKCLVPSINAEPLNPNIRLENSPFYVVKKPTEWKQPHFNDDETMQEYPLRAAISSFGAGGSNTHLILEEYKEIQRINKNSARIPRLIVLSAKDEKQLLIYAKKIAEFIENTVQKSENHNITLDDIAYTLCTGREEMDVRLALIVQTIQEVAQKLKFYILKSKTENHTSKNLFESNIFKGSIENAHTNILFRGDLGDDIVQLILEKNDLSKIAQIWVEGTKIPWEKLFPDDSKKKVSMPAYPFKKDRYWLKTDVSESVTKDLNKIIKTEIHEPEVLENDHVSAKSHEDIQSDLTNMISGFLKIQVNKLDMNVDLRNYGFDSLTGMKLINRLVDLYHVKITPKVLFAHSSIAALAQYLFKHQDLSVIKISQLKQSKDLSVSFDKENSELVAYPLSSGQKGLWLIYQMAPESYAYNVPTAFKINGTVDILALKKSFEKIVMRHQSLRAYITLKNNHFVQCINPEGNFFFETEKLDVSLEAHLDNGSKKNNGINRLLRRKVREPFNLETGPLLRVHLFSFTDTSHVLLITVHHIVFDGPAFLPLSRDLFSLYESELTGNKALLPSLTASYQDFVNFQNNLLETDTGREHKKYWLNKFSGDIPILNLPLDHPRPHIQSYKGEVYTSEIPYELAKQVESLSKEENVSVFALLLAAYYVFLYKYSRQDDLLIGAPVAGRSQTGFEDLVGYFVNMVVLRINVVKDHTFLSLLEKVQHEILDVMTYGDYPFYDIVHELNLQKDLSQSPLFQVVFVFQNWMRSMDKLIFQNSTQDENNNHPLSADFEPMLNIQQEGVYDLTLEIIEIEQNYIMNLKYNPDLFEEKTIVRMSNHYRTLLNEIVSNPKQKINELQLLTENETKKLLVNWSQNYHTFPKDRCIHHLFEEQVKKNPNQIAIRHSKTELTYQELNNQANSIAYCLIKKGIKPNRVTGLMIERSPEMVTGILGTLKAGGAYIPIDPQYPGERIEHMLYDGNARVLLTKEKSMEQFSFTDLMGLKHKSAKTFCTKKQRQITDLDALPVPDRSLIDFDKYDPYIGLAMVKHCFAIQGTRGCPYKCAYCHKIWPKTHIFRSAEHIFNEIKLYYDMGVRRFAIIDDIFNQNKKNSTLFFQMLIKNKMKVHLFFPNGIRGDIMTKDYIDLMVEAGTVNLAMALETASPRLQKLIQKNIQLDKLRENIDYFCEKHPQVILDLFTMHGFPTETEEEAMMTMDFIKTTKWLHFPYVHILRIYPNTDMEKLALENGISQESILKSANTAWHELPETLGFEKSFTLSYQAKFLNEYFLNKDRLKHVLKHQRKIMTEDEVVQKYNSYLPIDIKKMSDLLKFCNIDEQEVHGDQYLTEKETSVPKLNSKVKLHFTKSEEKNNQGALRILLLDLSQFFSDPNSEMLYDVVEPPLGLMYIMTYLNKEFGNQINGKIAKSRIDFNSYDELQQLIQEFKPQIVGLRSLTFYKDFFHKTASIIKQWMDIPIIAGGPYATSDYETILQDRNIELVVLSEGEITTTKIVDEILKNKGKFPSSENRDEVLNSIDGIAFVPQKKKNEIHFAREIVILDHLTQYMTGEVTENPDHINTPYNLIYIIFTSGSTGKPKGAGVYHRGFTNLLNWYENEFNICKNDRFLLITSLSFDLTQKNIFASLINGGSLYITSQEYFDPDAILKEIDEHNITLLNCTPGMFNHLMEYCREHQNKEDLDNTFKQLSSLRQIFLGGEPISIPLLKNFCDQEQKGFFQIACLFVHNHLCNQYQHLPQRCIVHLLPQPAQVFLTHPVRIKCCCKSVFQLEPDLSLTYFYVLGKKHTHHYTLWDHMY